MRAFIARGAWIRPFGNIVYLTPAFTITSAEVTILTNAIKSVLHQA
jgi:adenosylmethionine-8-amino-7-oxononanoate aminotransferase